MKKLTALLVAIFAIVNCHAQDTLFRFALITDTHIGVQTAQEDLERTIADINGQPQIEFAVFSGDVTEFGSDEELQLAKSIINKLNKPWYIIPGNHDTKWSESGCNSFRTVFGNETFSFEHKGYRFIGTNCGPNMRMGPGQVPRENIVWLDERLKQQNSRQPLIYINHYPQDEGLNNWYDILDRLRGQNLKVMICGHGHTNNAYTWEGIPGVMCRSNLRAKAAIGGYNIISVTQKSIVFNERTPGAATLPAWHTVALEGHSWITNPPRPSYAVNDSFPSVKVKWQIQEAGDMGSAVAITGGMVIYTNTNGDVKAASLSTGKNRWKFSAGGKIYSTPLVYGNKYVVVPCTDGYVYCLNLENGRLAWKHHRGKAIVSSPALYRDLAIIAGSDGSCEALHIPTGERRWTYNHIKGFVETKPFVYQGKVFFGSWGNQFYALDAATGAEAWVWSNGATNRMFSPAAVWPVAYDGKTWIVSPDKYMTVLNTETGKEIWRFRDSLNFVRESMGISADSQRIYAKTMQGNIIALSSRSAQRELVWKSPVEMGYEICPSPVTERFGVIYAAGQSGVVYALSPTDGRLLWKHKFSNCLVNTVQPVAENLVIVSSMDGKLVCIETAK